MRLLVLSLVALVALGSPVGKAEDATENRRQLKRTDTAALKATYTEVQDGYQNVLDRYKPIVEKLLTNKMPDFLGDFMTTVNGFTSDLSWIADQPAISAMLYPDAATATSGAADAVPLPSSLMAGPGLPDTSMCGNSGICKDVIDWVRNVNQDFRTGTEPSPLQQVAMANTANKEAPVAEAAAGK